jgi:DMSO/TMAO reductase YedYZ molybdopterin-dependent catalytic subunit
MKKAQLIITLLALIALISECATADEGAVGGETGLTVGEKAYTQSALEAFGTMTTDYTNKDGETTTYSGVSLAALLQDAGVSGSGTLVFTAADGYQADMELGEALACADCIVAFDNGSLRMVMPEMSGKLQIKDVIEIGVE